MENVDLSDNDGKTGTRLVQRRVNEDGIKDGPEAHAAAATAAAKGLCSSISQCLRCNKRNDEPWCVVITRNLEAFIDSLSPYRLDVVIALAVAFAIVYFVGGWNASRHIPYEETMCRSGLVAYPGGNVWAYGSVICSRDSKDARGDAIPKIISYHNSSINLVKTCSHRGLKVQRVAVKAPFCGSGVMAEEIDAPDYMWVRHDGQATPDGDLVAFPHSANLAIAWRYGGNMHAYCADPYIRMKPVWAFVC